MKKIAKILNLFVCFALMFAFAACVGESNETKEQMLNKVNAALAKTGGETSYDFRTETTTITPLEISTLDYSRKIINSGGVRKIYTRQVYSFERNGGIFGHDEEKYYTGNYMCFVSEGQFSEGHYWVAEQESNSIFETFELVDFELSDSDVESWSKSVKNGSTTYNLNLTSSEIFEMSEILDAYEYMQTDLTTRFELTVNSNGHVKQMKISVNFVIEDIEYSIVAVITFNAFGNAVVIDIPNEVTSAINEFIGKQASADEALKQAALSEINAAFEKSSGADLDVSCEIANTYFATAVSARMKLITAQNGVVFWQEGVMSDGTPYEYCYIDGYAYIAEGEYNYVQAGSYENIFGNVYFQFNDLSKQDVKAWSKETESSSVKYSLELKLIDVLDLGASIFDEFDYADDITFKVDLTIGENGYLAFFGYTLDFTVDGEKYSYNVNYTFNAFKGNVHITIPQEVMKAIYDYIG